MSAPGRIAALVAAALVGCAPPPPTGGPPPETPAGQPGQTLELERSGTLRQDEISITLRAGPLRIEVTPLLPWVLEAAAPDTQARLARIAEEHGAALAEGSGGPDPVLMLVTLSALQPDTEFRPGDLHMVARGLRERPLAIRGISPGWGTGRVGQQRTAVAVYAYPGTMDLTRELTVEYGAFSDGSWVNIVPRIEAERGRRPGPVGLQDVRQPSPTAAVSPRGRTS